MEIEWDENKAVANFRKHKVSFDEAQTVFDDSLARIVKDSDHSIDEHRFLTVGESSIGRLLIISHTIEDEKVRLISARKPTRSERKSYEER